jgi:hypothetical protein
MQIYLTSWIENTVTFISFTECKNRDSLMERMLRLIAILIVHMFYGLYAKW